MWAMVSEDTFNHGMGKEVKKPLKITRKEESQSWGFKNEGGVDVTLSRQPPEDCIVRSWSGLG